MLNKFCVYNGRIFLTLDTYLIAYSYKKYPETHDEKFLEYLKIKIPVKYVKDIALEVIENYVTGLKSLLILVMDLKGLNKAFIYCDTFRKKLCEIVLPNWPVTTENDFNLFVSDGPTFLFHANGAFHLFAVPYHINNTLDNQFICSCSKEYKILQFKSFGPFKNDNTYLVMFLLIISCDYSSRQRIKIVGFVSDTKNLSSQQLSLHFFFPLYYETVLKAVQVTKVLPFFKTKPSSLNDVEWKENISVICTKDDYLVFSNAVLKYCCKLNLSLSEVMCIKTEFSNVFSENMDLVLTSENKAVFFISTKRDIICEVVKYWTDIEVAITGDILRKGSKQVLLLKQADLHLWQNNCILYDMLSFIPVDLFCQSAMPDDCLKATITGLERKVQVGKSSFKELEHEISQKSTATIDALSKLNEFRMKSECLKLSHVFQESLVDLILSKDENKVEHMLPEFEPTVKLLHEKQKIIDNCWILNLFFKNEGERSICNPSIKILMKGSQVTCVQKLFVHNSDNFSFSDKCSWHINPKEKFTIVLSFQFSTFHTEDIFLILTYYDGSTDEFNNEIFLTEGKKVLLQHQLYLETRITLTDVRNYQRKMDVSSPDGILFTRVSQQRIRLCISSLHSNISSLEDMLMSTSFKSVDLHLFQYSSMKCMVFNDQKSVLFGLHIVLPQNSRKNVAEIETFTRNEKEVLLLIQYLYQHLSEDIIIFPCLNSKDEFSQMKKDVTNSMKNEIDMLISSLRIHNISEEMRRNYLKLLSSQMAGTITIPKATYYRIRRALVKREYITDSILKCFG